LETIILYTVLPVSNLFGTVVSSEAVGHWERTFN
jgi:hypothetical protein